MSHELIQFRNATLDDLPFIIEIYNATIPYKLVTADTRPVEISQRLNWFNQHNSDDSPLWVIYYQGVKCGWISLSEYSERAGFKQTREVSLYLNKDYHGKQIGKFALFEIEHHAKKHAIKSIISRVFRLNYPSIKLFERAGYQQWGLLPAVAQVDDIEHDLVILGKKLSI